MSDSPDCVEASQQADVPSSPVTLPPSPEKPYLAAVKAAAASVAPTVQLSLPAALATTSGALPPWKATFGSFTMERGDTLSSAGSHDRMETLSNLTSHMELESVVSSWVDDDDYFLQSAMHDIQVTTGQQQQGADKGWKIASSSNNASGSGRQRGGGAQRRQQPQRQRNGGGYASGIPSSTVAGTSSSIAPTQSVSGGRFDALSSEPKRRR
jgi:hypothetical protein